MNFFKYFNKGLIYFSANLINFKKSVKTIEIADRSQNVQGLKSGISLELRNINPEI